MSKRFRVRYKVELEGELEIYANGYSDATRIIREDTTYAELTEGFILGQQDGEISVLNIEPIE